MINAESGNVGEWAGKYTKGELLAEMQLLDSLPSPIRRTIHDAPYDYSVTDIASAYKRSNSGDFDWDTMRPRRADPLDFAREMVGNFQIDVQRNSMTGAEYMGRYWFKKQDPFRKALTQRRRRAILRAAYAHAIPTPRSKT